MPSPVLPRAKLPVTSVPMRLPLTTLAAKLEMKAIPPAPLVEMTLPWMVALAAGWPAGADTSMPLPPLDSAISPVGSTPMKLSITLSATPWTMTPETSLPEMTLPCPATVPPIVSPLEAATMP